MNIKKIEKEFGVDFEKEDVKSIQDWLRKVGYPGLAGALDIIEKKPKT